MANGGTIFLDEIGTVSAKMQVELLRVIETKQFTRVGGNESIKSDFRVIARLMNPSKTLLNRVSSERIFITGWMFSQSSFPRCVRE